MALNEYLCSHTNLHEEIEAQTGTVHGIEDVESQTPSLEDSYDDTDVPSSVVIRDALGVEVSGDNVFEQTCVQQAWKDDEHGSLIADGDKENIWAWNNGEKWGNKLPSNDGWCGYEFWRNLVNFLKSYVSWVWHIFLLSNQPSVTHYGLEISNATGAALCVTVATIQIATVVRQLQANEMKDE
jgi:hypothetical protein